MNTRDVSSLSVARRGCCRLQGSGSVRTHSHTVGLFERWGNALFSGERSAAARPGLVQKPADDLTDLAKTSVVVTVAVHADQRRREAGECRSPKRVRVRR